MSKFLSLHGKAGMSLCMAAVFSAFFAAGASAQNMDTAYVPFRVNVDAKATAHLAGGIKFEKLVRAGSTDTLHIISESTTPVSMGKVPMPVAMHNHRGTISLELSRQLYRGVDIALYSLNGKQIMHAKADASEALKSISHPNVRMGVYVLSVKGVGGSIFTARLTHSGGGMNIDVAFSNEKLSSGSLMEKVLPGNWTITVSAEGHLDTSYAFVPETGRGKHSVHHITLRQTHHTSSSSSAGDEPSSSSAEITPPSSSSVVIVPSSSAVAVVLSSSSVVVVSSSSSSAVAPSSSSTEITPSSSSVETVVSSSSSSETEPSSSSSVPPSSSTVAPATLTCGPVPVNGFSGFAVTPPVLTCSNGKTATNVAWSASAPDWSSPATGTYSGISVTAACGTSNGLTANCSGSLTVQSVISCSMASAGYEGVAIVQPVIACKNGSVSSGIVFSGSVPNWGNPVAGDYEVFAKANCGQGISPAVSCGSLTVSKVTLTCGSVPTRGISDVEIAPPVLTCNNGETPANVAWSENAPDWISPVYGTYSDVSATADCGTSSGLMANCSGTLTVVNPDTLTCGSVPKTGTYGNRITPPTLTCRNGGAPTNIVWSNAPNWSSPASGTYSNISATATCGISNGLTANCSGSLSVCSAKDNTSTHYCSNGAMKAYGSVTYNGRTYKTVVIGTQTWMAENLNYNASVRYDWVTAMALPASCSYTSSCSVQSKHRGVCPVGWHIPSNAEWGALMTAVGGSNTAGTKLKTTSGWSSNYDGTSGNGTNDYGFSALPTDAGGYAGIAGCLWSATEYDGGRAYGFLVMASWLSSGAESNYGDKANNCFVRCLQDEPFVEKLTCGSVPTSGTSGTAITPPTLTCSNWETPANAVWSNAPNWSSPAAGTYSNISATADCGTSNGLTANCSGTLAVVNPLTCGSVPASGISDAAITPPALTCSNGGTPTNTVWSNAPNWSSPATGTYSNISATADCGTSNGLTANCSGTLAVVNPLTCGSVPASGISGTAITPPVLTCSNGEMPTNTVWSNAPNWSSPATGTYSNINVTATCGTSSNLTASCSGSLTVVNPVLTCGSVPTAGTSGTAISPPTLTCSNGGTPANTVWSNAPNWSSPATGTYSNINVTATCGTSSNLTASCSGSLTVVNPVLTCGTMPASGISDVAIAPPVLTCNNGETPANAVWSNAPNWNSPATGTYGNISATAACGTSNGLTANCSGSLTVNPATLTCSSVPASEISDVAITPPALTCNNGKTASNISWSGAPAWSNPAGGIYNDVSATANCGTSSGLTANCPGSLQVYKTVVIGGQTWMAENLNYNVSGSKCYSDSESYCNTYGRLYDWSTAMNLASRCNSNSCPDQIQSKHRGICPSGWHIPSYDEGRTLSSYVQSNSGCSSCDARLLKSTSGWNSGGNGTDQYGFSALPGGYGSSDGSFGDVGSLGYWWSTYESYSNVAYYQYMYDFDSAGWNNRGKSLLYSVRCLQD